MKRRFLIPFLLVVLVVGGLLIHQWLAPDQTPTLQLNDLSPEAVLLSQGAIWPSDTSHPLNQHAVEETWPTEGEGLLAYQSGEKLSAFLPDQGVAVASYFYRYDRAAQAEQAAEQLARYLRGESGLMAEKAGPQRAAGFRGEGFLLSGSEQDAVYWFVGAQGKTLFLLMVNGMDASAVLSVADVVVSGLGGA